jgi:hypothetical protein
MNKTNNMNLHFNYLKEKILNAEFKYSPFKHIVIDNFFSKEQSTLINLLLQKK